MFNLGNNTEVYARKTKYVNTNLEKYLQVNLVIFAFNVFL